MSYTENFLMELLLQRAKNRKPGVSERANIIAHLENALTIKLLWSMYLQLIESELSRNLLRLNFPILKILSNSARQVLRGKATGNLPCSIETILQI